VVYLWVAMGGAIGSVLRYWLGNTVALAVGSEFPWGTLLINIIGSFVISFFGLLTGAHGRLGVPDEARIFVTVGICGGFTTFSSFSLQTADLMAAGELVAAACYIVSSVALCVAGTFLGYWLATRIGMTLG
jgi:CrcB protein